MPSSFSELGARIRPGMRVGIDGVSAAGKTTFADALVPFVDAPVVRAFARGEPIRTRIFDHVLDRALDEPPALPPRGAVLILSGRTSSR